MSMEAKEKVRENRLRRVLNRRGLNLVKSRRKDPGAIDYGMYMITDLETKVVIAGIIAENIPDFSLDDVETWIEEYDKRERE